MLIRGFDLPVRVGALLRLAQPIWQHFSPQVHILDISDHGIKKNNKCPLSGGPHSGHACYVMMPFQWCLGKDCRFRGVLSRWSVWASAVQSPTNVFLLLVRSVLSIHIYTDARRAVCFIDNQTRLSSAMASIWNVHQNHLKGLLKDNLPGPSPRV